MIKITQIVTSLILLLCLLCTSGCSNTTQLRFKGGSAVFRPENISDARCILLDIGVPNELKPSDFKLKIYLKNGSVFDFTQSDIVNSLKKEYPEAKGYDASGKIGPFCHPSKTYFRWPEQTKSYNEFKFGYFFTLNKEVISVSLSWRSDLIEAIEVLGKKRTLPLKGSDVVYLFGEPDETLRYFSE